MINDLPAAGPPVRGILANRSRMAAILGVAMTTLDDWVKHGCPVYCRARCKGSPAQFDTAAVIAWRTARRDAVVRPEGCPMPAQTVAAGSAMAPAKEKCG